MNTIITISCSFNDFGFRPLNWEQFQKLNKGKAIIRDDDFEFFTVEGEKMSGTLSLVEIVEKKNWYAKEYIAKFSETGLNCFFSVCWQKINGEFFSNLQLHMHCLVDPNFWFSMLQLQNNSHLKFFHFDKI